MSRQAKVFTVARSLFSFSIVLWCEKFLTWVIILYMTEWLWPEWNFQRTVWFRAFASNCQCWVLFLQICWQTNTFQFLGYCFCLVVPKKFGEKVQRSGFFLSNYLDTGGTGGACQIACEERGRKKFWAHIVNDYPKTVDHIPKVRVFLFRMV